MLTDQYNTSPAANPAKTKVNTNGSRANILAWVGSAGAGFSFCWSHIVKPINIGGVIVSNATLHNEDEILRKDIRIGDTVKIERAGDVIPHVIEVDFKKRKTSSKKYIFPNKCPSCGSKTVKEYNKVTKKIDAVRRCPSEGYYCDKISIEKSELGIVVR